MIATEASKTTILSIILIVRHPEETPDAVLSALANEMDNNRDADLVEIILVDGRLNPTGSELCEPIGLIRHNRPGFNMPFLKAQGLMLAQGQMVAFLEPKAVPVANWLNTALASVRAHPGAALGGAVLPGSGGASDRAAYVFEYGKFSPAALAREGTLDLPGNNMILPTKPLRDLCRDILRIDGLNKPFCQARLTKYGLDVVMIPQMAVRMKTQHCLRPLLLSRYRYARCFGGTRVSMASPVRRWLYKLGAFVVPFLLLRQHLWSGIQPSENGRLRLSGLLVLCALCLAWSAGEAVGSWKGAGESCSLLY